MCPIRIDLEVLLKWTVKSQEGVRPSFWLFITVWSLGELILYWISRTIHSRGSLSYCPQAVISGHLIEELKDFMSVSFQVVLICLMAVSSLAAFLTLPWHIGTLVLGIFSIFLHKFLIYYFVAVDVSLRILSLCEPLLQNKFP